MATLIQPPDLDIRDDEQLAAAAIGFVSGGLTTDRIDAQIAERRTLREMVVAGLDTPICPELTNANASSPHTVLLEAMAWLTAQLAHRINQLPVRDEIAFAGLFQITPRAATFATSTLTFTTTGTHDATVPSGTQVATSDGAIVFATNEELVILSGSTTGTVAAQRTVAGATLLSTDQLVKMRDVIAFVTAVTNANPVDSGTGAETTDAALGRMRSYQRRAERLVSAADIENAILQEALGGNGIVRAFPMVLAGNFSVRRAGHTTIVVMTAAGGNVADELKAAIRTLLLQAVGNQFFYLLDPIYVSFVVEATIRISPGTSSDAVRRSVESSLRTFYAAKPGNFGRAILRAEAIEVIESTQGVDRVVPVSGSGPILSAPAADLVLAPYEMPRLGTVTLNVV